MKKIPIVACSAFESIIDIQNCLAALILSVADLTLLTSKLNII